MAADATVLEQMRLIQISKTEKLWFAQITVRLVTEQMPVDVGNTNTNTNSNAGSNSLVTEQMPVDVGPFTPPSPVGTAVVAAPRTAAPPRPLQKSSRAARSTTRVCPRAAWKRSRVSAPPRSLRANTNSNTNRV